MKWEYEIIRTENFERFQLLLTELGNDSWEAISASYAISAPEKSSLGVGLEDYEIPPQPMWIALMKREKEIPN